MIARCIELHPNRKFLAQDIETTIAGNKKYDLVLDIGVIEYYEDPGLHMQQIKSLMASDGVLIIEAPNSSNVTKKLNTNKALKKILRNKKQNLNVKHQEVKHREKSLRDFQSLAKEVDLSVFDYAYVACLFIPEVLPGIKPLNEWLSMKINGLRCFRFIAKYTATTIVCCMK